MAFFSDNRHTVFYEWLMEELSEEDRAAFSRIPDDFYLRSRKQSRTGFPDVRKRMEELLNEENI